MNNIFLITKREFLTQAKKKSFLILTVLAPVLIILFGAIVGWMLKANQTKYTIEVVDRSGLFLPNLKSSEAISYVALPKNLQESHLKNLKSNEIISGILLVPELKDTSIASIENATQLIMNTSLDKSAKQKIINDLSEITRKIKVKQLGISEQALVQLDQDFQLKTINVSSDKKEDSDFSFGVKSALSIGLMYVTFMFIIIYGVRVMRSVLEEKNNRVVEIIISSVKPFELMMGKILGVTLVALFQFFVWISMSIGGALLLHKKLPGVGLSVAENGQSTDMLALLGMVSNDLLALNYPLIIVVFILFFILGYLFYSSIYAAIGSAVDNETETQQFTLFAILPLSLGMYGSFSVLNNPDGPMGFWLSIIPFTSPVAMIARIPFGVPIWQIVLSVTLLLGTTVFMIFVAGKIYRVGILMYGNKASLKEIWKWMRY